MRQLDTESFEQVRGLDGAVVFDSDSKLGTGRNVDSALLSAVENALEANGSNA